MHTEEGQQRQKRKENRVAKVFTTAGLDCDRERHRDLRKLQSTSARVDFQLKRDEDVIFNHEVDEHQHNDRMVSCETRRMADVTAHLRLEGFKGKAVWIRYNPDAFKVEGAKRRVKREERERILVEFLKTYKPQLDMEIIYMFYDTIAGKPAIFLDPDYPEELKKCVTRVIVG